MKNIIMQGMCIAGAAAFLSASCWVVFSSRSLTPAIVFSVAALGWCFAGMWHSKFVALLKSREGTE